MESGYPLRARNGIAPVRPAEAVDPRDQRNCVNSRPMGLSTGKSIRRRRPRWSIRSPNAARHSMQQQTHCAVGASNSACPAISGTKRNTPETIGAHCAEADTGLTAGIDRIGSRDRLSFAWMSLWIPARRTPTSPRAGYAMTIAGKKAIQSAARRPLAVDWPRLLV